MTTTADKLKKAKTFRSIEINRITELCEVSQQAAVDDIIKLDLFRQRASIIEDIWTSFFKQHNNIISMTDDDAKFKEEDVIRKEFENTYFKIKTNYYQLFEKNTMNVTNNDNIPRVKLPELKLNKFTGDIKSFISFIDVYDAVIHNNDQLTKIEKFSHLINSLEGPPRNFIQCYSLSADNYDTAYQALKDKYTNKRILATSHWNEIENAPRINSDNPVSLRKMIDTFVENVSALRNLKYPTEHWDFILSQMLLKRMDITLITRFESHHASNAMPSFKELIDFLNIQCNACETVTSASKLTSRQKSSQSNFSQKSFLSNSRNLNKPCIFCKTTDHLIYKCQYFLNKTPAERCNLTKANNLCVNCLSDCHSLKNCRSTTTCRYCHNKHHSLLHDNNFSNNQNTHNSRNYLIKNSQKDNMTTEDKSENLGSPQNNLPTTSFNCRLGNSNAILPTIKLEVKDNIGCFYIARALLDCGSECNYISKSLVKKLNLPVSRLAINIFGLGDMKTFTNSGKTTLYIKPLGKITPTYNVDAIVLDNICSDMPSLSFDISQWSHLENLKLADSEFNVSAPIDLILGVGIFHEILCDGKIQTVNNLPSAINTTFGYVLMGNASDAYHGGQETTAMSTKAFFVKNKFEKLNDTLQNFWTLEEIPDKNLSSSEDNKCEEIFSSTVHRSASGRYEVTLPFSTLDQPKFFKSKLIAVRRFLALEKRLNANPEFGKQYYSFMKDYLDNNYMSLAEIEDEHAYFLPHFGIAKPQAVTTKLRVVFDASAKDFNNLSLNDTLYVGPKLQKDISTILLHFRLKPVAIIADIKSMYLRILLNQEQASKFQRIVWRFSPKEPIQEYILNTVVFGISSSPYLALRTLKQLALEEGHKFPLASAILSSDIYVDDIVTSCENLDQALDLQSQLIQLLKLGGFELHKWASNSQEFLSHLNIDGLCGHAVDFDSSIFETVKVLGLKWNPKLDTFFYSVTPLHKFCSKRNMLSDLARIYDPLGFLTPLTVFAKLLIQKLWLLELQWDDAPPDEVIHQWKLFQEQLPTLTNISIPRLLPIGQAQYVELCGFCDGSTRAYAAVVYIRIVHSTYIETRLLSAKAKVTPLKTITIPRIELCAALLLSKLTNYILKTFSHLSFKNIFNFTDSMVVLHWIHSSPHKWKPFVGNRISLIQDKTASAVWSHVPSDQNIADCASRGSLPAEFSMNSEWWVGPKFLKYPYSEWPSTKLTSEVNYDLSLEVRKTAFTALAQNNFLDELLSKWSSLHKIQMIIAWAQRFIHNLRNPQDKNTGNFDSQDMFDALLVLVKHIQNSHFQDEIRRIKANKPPSKPFRKLGAFLDSHQILRVGGRLKNSLLDYEKKFPILLPKNSSLTDLIIEDTHKRYCHPGLQTLLYLLNQNFWILSPRRAIRKILSRCLKCWRLNPPHTQPPMGNLPPSRITQAKPFSIVGIDFAGPVYITMGKLRGAKKIKAYICIFVCFVSKAIHIELVTDLSTENFLCALRRFIARRGKCQKIITDNAQNFVGSQKYLYDILRRAASQEKITWEFNPPYGSHFGGLFEAAVKSVKKHLFKVLDSHLLTYEEFNTVLIQIESLLNSRPLCSISSDPNDFSALTPGHFLTLQPLTCLPDRDVSHLKINRLDRYQLLLRLHSEFWRRWHTEYLQTLQQKSKWIDPAIPLQEGSLVVVKQDNLPPMRWKIARISKLIKGNDGIARVAEIRTSEGVYVRPVVKLCPLPNA